MAIGSMRSTTLRASLVFFPCAPFSNTQRFAQMFGDGNTQRPAEAAAISSLPEQTWTKKQGDGDDCSCCICLEQFEEEAGVKRLACMHTFHSGCIDRWLRTNGVCPICKKEVGVGEDTEREAVEGEGS